MKVFITGDEVRITGEKLLAKGETGTIKSWHHDDVYTVTMHNGRNIVVFSTEMEKTAPIHYCQQCNKDMGNEWILGPVCGSCCRKNHRKVIGKR